MVEHRNLATAETFPLPERMETAEPPIWSQLFQKYFATAVEFLSARRL